MKKITKLKIYYYFFNLAIAQISLTSLRKTFKFGGRRNVPSQIELDALIVCFNFKFNLTFSLIPVHSI